MGELGSGEEEIGRDIEGLFLNLREIAYRKVLERRERDLKEIQDLPCTIVIASQLN